MKTINLRDYYPFYHNDLFIEVSDEVAAALQEAERQERNYLRRVVYNKAFYTRWTLGTVSSKRRCFRLCLPVKSTSGK